MFVSAPVYVYVYVALWIYECVCVYRCVYVFSSMRVYVCTCLLLFMHGCVTETLLCIDGSAGLIAGWLVD